MQIDTSELDGVADSVYHRTRPPSNFPRVTGRWTRPRGERRAIFSADVRPTQHIRRSRAPVTECWRWTHARSLSCRSLPPLREVTLMLFRIPRYFLLSLCLSPCPHLARSRLSSSSSILPCSLICKSKSQALHYGCCHARLRRDRNRRIAASPASRDRSECSYRSSR